ncbi:MAG TPA: SDR family oxidoreductase [Planctomycetota bacterium]|nr:SDR family oxidoreductase [Planctomycetota bacterium]
MNAGAPRVALVTGAGRRVGAVVARGLAARGWAVVVHYRSSRADAEATVAAITSAGGRAALVQADQRDEAQVVRAVAEAAAAFGRLDALVNSASDFPRDDVETLDADAFVDVLRTNVVGPFLFAREAAPYLRRSGDGRIVMLGDIYEDRPLGGRLAYSASKAALASVVKSLARAYAPGIAVNAVSPGLVLPPPDADAAALDAVVRRTPTKRRGTPEDVLAAVAFFLEGPSQIVGQTLRVDGGRTLMP